MDRKTQIEQFIYAKDSPDYATVSLEDLALFFGVHRNTLIRWRKEPDFPDAIRMPGGIRFQVGGVRRYLKRKARVN